MEFSIDFIDVGDGDAIIVWGRDIGVRDRLFFIDGGDTGNGEKVVDHYNTFIKPYLYQNKSLTFVNTHPHTDHINGLVEIVESIGAEFSFAIYNDPVECISSELQAFIYKKYIQKDDPDITHLYETFHQVEKLNSLCKLYNIKRYNGYSRENSFLDGAFRILGPSLEYYVSLVQEFTDVDFLKAHDFTKGAPKAVFEVVENIKPCDTVDATNDQSPENLSSIVIQLTATDGKKCLLTADAGVGTFDYIELDGFDLSGNTLVQLPHHGSRRNVSAEWLKDFGATYFVASAVGDSHHPRRAVINCVKRNLPEAKVYSTHQTGTLNYATNRSVFPNRGWSSLEPL
ncbi:MAG: hypothetical protein ACN4EP_10810 [Sediminibacterium sp.]